MNSRALMVEERVQKVEYGPKFCVTFPWVFKVDFCVLKGILNV